MSNCRVCCLICGKIFSKQANVNKHRMIVHGESHKQVIQYHDESSLYKCLEGCNVSFKSNSDLIFHLNDYHQLKTEVLEMKFSTYDEFKTWLTKEEKDNTVQYYKSTGVKKSFQCEKIYFVCVRSGSQPSLTLQNRSRSKKSQGSCKINKNCTSKIIVSKNTETNECIVKYFKTHYGHNRNIEHVRIAKEERDQIASKLILGVSTSKILDSSRDCIGTQLKRRDIITRKDINNIKTSYNIDLRDGTRHKNDAASVTLWVEECKLSEKNPVIYYKKQGEISSEYKLGSDDFCLIIMTSMQIELLQKFGNRIICIDSTHGLNSYDFDMTSILVVDEFQEGFPVAFMFSNRKDSHINKVFFMKVKEAAGVISPVSFMTDITNVFYNPWSEVMGSVPKQLFCSWHIDRAWQTNLSKVIGEEKRGWVYKTLKYLQMLLDVNEFEKQFKDFIECLLDDVDTKRMGEYLKGNYYQNRNQWAYCYRLKCNINTNMYLESMHKVIKYDYLQGKKIKRLDKSLHALQKFIRDKTVDRLIKLTKGKTSRHQQNINNRHRVSLSANFTITKNCDSNSFLVIDNGNEKEFIVSQNNSSPCCALKCEFCNICTHSYDCTCIDFLIRTNICKHIHYVCLKKDTDACTSKNISQNNNEVTTIVGEVTNTSDTCSFKNNSENNDEVTKIVGELTNTIMDKASLLKDIEATALQIIAASQNCDNNTLTLISKNLKTTAALCKLKADNNIDSFTQKLLNEPCNKNIEKQQFYSTKKRHNIKKRKMSKPNSDEIGMIQDTLCGSSILISKNPNNDHLYC